MSPTCAAVLAAVVCLVSACAGRDRVLPAEEPPQPECVIGGPWTTWPSAFWTRRIAEEGGYRIVSDTGSALVAAGKGHEFYIWATEPERPIRAIVAQEKWHKLAVVRDVTVYGDRDLWRFWLAQGFIFWVKAGPRPESVLPEPGRLAPVIDASLRLKLEERCGAGDD